MTKIIFLTNGGQAIVDDIDYDYLSLYAWYKEKNHKTCYARRTDSCSPIRMHNQIMGEEKGKIIDHIDGNGLHNNRNNLRFVDYVESNQNRKKPKNNTSGYKNVVKIGKKWRAQIQISNNPIHLGMFDTPEDASLAVEEYKKLLKFTP